MFAAQFPAHTCLFVLCPRPVNDADTRYVEIVLKPYTNLFHSMSLHLLIRHDIFSEEYYPIKTFRHNVYTSPIIPKSHKYFLPLGP